MDINAVLARIDANLPEAQQRWFSLLRIASISAQPAHAADCLTAAEWLRAELAGMGFDAAVHATAGHPVVLAHNPGPGPTAPHVMFYGHYDVQPAEPFELWDHPPFEPTLVDGPHGPRVYARGAVDDKGQVMLWLEALRALHEETGSLPVRVTVLIEGEEEVGSPSLEAFLSAHRDALADAEIAIISDTGMWDIETPALTTRLRGMVYSQVTLRAADRDLHSGIFGGSALNPINALTRIIGQLHDDQGRVQLPGFYDGIPDLTPAQSAAWDSLGFDESAFLGGIGLSHPAGEHDRAPLERLWARPTADVNGIWGGYQGPGGKTVIAAEAGAKISFRLVPGQDPERVADSLRHFVAERAPKDAKVDVQIFNASPGIEIAADGPFVKAAQRALADEYGRPAVLIGSGGSIPVVESFRRLLGLDSLLMGFGLDDDQVHSPNEKFEVTCFRHGIRSHARLLAALSQRS